VQFGGISDSTTLAEVAHIEWSNRQTPSREITASLALAKAPNKLPYRDYHVGSIVNFPTEAGGIEPIGVAQITLSRDIAPDFSGNLVLDTKIKNRELRLVELGKQGVGGVPTISGNGATVALALPQSVQQALNPVGTSIEGYWRTAPSGYFLEDGSAVSRSFTALYNCLNPNLGAVAISIASPGVVTLTAHGLVAGNRVVFETTGALPTGLVANTRYFVLAAGLTANTFRVSTTDGGSAINTTGTQSGVHNVRLCPHGLGDGSTTFNLPDSRGLVLVAKSSDAEFDRFGKTGGAKSGPVDGVAKIQIGTTGSNWAGISRATAPSGPWNTSHRNGPSSSGDTTSSSQSTGAALDATSSALQPYMTVNRAIKY
jgi:hypothetical protein